MAPGHRISAEEHTTPDGLQHRLNEDGYRRGDETVGGCPDCGFSDPADGVEDVSRVTSSMESKTPAMAPPAVLAG